MKCTGMREAREMISLANALHMRIMVGCMTETRGYFGSSPNLTKVEWADLDGNYLIANDCFEYEAGGRTYHP